MLTILKNSSLEAVVKADASGTITLASLVTSLQRSLTVLTPKNLSGGTGYSNTLGVAVTGGTGTGCKVNIAVSATGGVTRVQIQDGGNGFTVNDTLTITGGGGNATFQVATISPVLAANLIGAQFMGDVNSSIVVSRNGTNIWNLSPENGTGGKVDFLEHDFVDTINNTNDIVVTIIGSAQIYVVIRKVQGYAAAQRVEELGIYGIE